MADKSERQIEIEKKLAAGESVDLSPDNEQPTIESETKVEEEKKPEVEGVEPQSSLKSKPWKEYVKERQQWRRERDEMKSQIDEIKSRYEERESKEYQQEMESEINQLAQQHKASPEVIKGILDMAAKRVQPQTDPTIKSELEEYREQTAFNREWDGLLDELTETYPNASYAQLRQAQKLMDDLSHSEDYSLEGNGENVPLSEILELEEAEFDKILASPRASKGFESKGHSAPDRDENEKRKKPDFESMSFDEIRKWEDERDAETSRLDRESQGTDYDEVSRRF
jgi:hypothetical protein